MKKAPDLFALPPSRATTHTVPYRVILRLSCLLSGKKIHRENLFSRCTHTVLFIFHSRQPLRRRSLNLYSSGSINP